MDPISIATTALGFAKSAYTVGATIYNFVQAARDVDHSVLALRRQVNGNGRLLETLASALRHPLLRSTGQENHDLWSHAFDSIDACGATVKELGGMLTALQAGRSNTVGLAWRQYRLGFKSDDINRLLGAMKTHAVNLQLALGIINVLVTASTPEVVITELGTRFERLERMIMAIDSRSLQSPPSATPDHAQGIKDVVLDKNTKALRQSANSVISGASTVAGFSLSGATVKSSLDPSKPAFEDFETSDDEEQQKPVAESTTGSEFGFPLNPNKRSRISDWLDRSSDVEEDGEDTESNIASSKTGTMSMPEFKPTTEELHEPHELIDDESSDDDIDYQVAMSIFSQASDKYSSEDFTGAESLIQLGFDQSQQLSFKKKQSLKLKDMQLKHAVCRIHAGKLDKAEETLLALAEGPVQTNTDAVVMLCATHELAGLNLRRGSLQAALIHCRQALKGRQKTKSIGKNHADYQASLRLLALIHWAKQDNIRAKAYADLLTEKLSAEDFDRILSIEYKMPSVALGQETIPISGAENHNLAPNKMNTSTGLERTDSRSTDVASVESASPSYTSYPQKQPLLTPGQLRQIRPMQHGASTATNNLPRRPVSNSQISRDPSMLEILRPSQSNPERQQQAVEPRPGPKLTNDDALGFKITDFPDTPRLERNNTTEYRINELDALFAHSNDTAKTGSETLSSAREHSPSRRPRPSLPSPLESDLLASSEDISQLRISSVSDPFADADYSGCKQERPSPNVPVLSSGHTAGPPSRLGLNSRRPPPQYTSLAVPWSSMDAKPQTRESIDRQSSTGVKSPARIPTHPRDFDGAIAIIKKQKYYLPSDSQVALMWATRKGHFTVVDYLLSRPEVDINIRQTGYLNNNESLLHIAGFNHHVDICVRLLKAGLNVDVEDNRSRTTMEAAAIHGMTEVYKCLLKHGAKVRRPGVHSKALVFTPNKRCTEFCGYLLTAGYKIDELALQGCDIVAASKGGNLALVKLLVASGVNIDWADDDGWTSLMYACKDSNLALIRWLMQNGADSKKMNNKGKSAQDIACALSGSSTKRRSIIIATHPLPAPDPQAPKFPPFV